jgi:hypothetical protein
MAIRFLKKLEKTEFGLTVGLLNNLHHLAVVAGLKIAALLQALER